MHVLCVGVAALVAVTLAIPAISSDARRDVIVFVRQDPAASGVNAGVDLWTIAVVRLRNLTRTPRLDERDPAWRPR